MQRQWLVDLRGDKNQEEVAMHSAIHRGHYSLIETGKRTPSVTVAKRIADYLGFDWTLFFEQNRVEMLQHYNAHVQNERNELSV